MSIVAAALGAAGLMSGFAANQQNQENFDSQMAMSKYQYEDMKRYNSALEQVHRLRAAGQNPAFSFGQDAGSAQAVTPPSGHPQVPLDMGGLASVGSAIDLNSAQRQNIEANTTKVNTDAELNRVDLRTRFLEKLSDIQNKLSDTNLKDSQRDFYLSQRDYLSKQIKFADERFEWENHNLRLEAFNKSLQNQALVIQNQYLPMLNDAQVKSLISTMALNYAAAGEHNANKEKIVQETVSECIRSGILGEDFYKNLPDAVKGKTYGEALKNHPLFKRLETTLDKVVYPMLEHSPSLFIPIK